MKSVVAKHEEGCGDEEIGGLDTVEEIDAWIKLRKSKFPAANEVCLIGPAHQHEQNLIVGSDGDRKSASGTSQTPPPARNALYTTNRTHRDTTFGR